jgi:HAD superfamily hydrolase (TIGR01549 family)
MAAARTDPPVDIVVFDLDGTLVDSDEALAYPFVTLGVPREEVTFGHVLDHECRRLGITVDDYLAHYDSNRVTPFPGVVDMIAALDRWAVCSNKQPGAGRAELAQFGWEPVVALFADAFDGPKRLGPVLDQLDASPETALCVGDTDHDRRCAADAGVRFALATWNPRSVVQPGDIALGQPSDLLGLLH